MSDRSRHALGSVLVIGPSSDHKVLQDGTLDRIAADVRTAETLAMAMQGQGEDVCPDLIVVLEEIGPAEVLDALRAVRARFRGTPSVVLSRDPSIESSIRFVREGAYDYIQAPLQSRGLERLLVAADAGRRAVQADRQFFCRHCPPGVPIVGLSKGMARALEMVQVIAESNCNPILILGETGTGKELAAKAVHHLRRGGNARFLAVNCAALTASLLDSELFGHEKGAFTGAERDKTGLFEAAGRGTIFLDEISEMPLGLQAKLLRVLQEKTFRKVGGTREMSCKATIIASSNRDLLKQVSRGKFRRDLYYRLAIFPVTIPPLRGRDRRGDIPLLAEYFIQSSTIAPGHKVRHLSAPVRDRLLEHDWPGNVRELRNVIERALILEKTDELRPSSIVIDSDGAQGAGSGDRSPSPDDFSLETAEREFILRALRETGWQRTRAAALLGITRATLHAKLKRYDIMDPERKSPAEEPAVAPVSGR